MLLKKKILNNLSELKKDQIVTHESQIIKPH